MTHNLQMRGHICLPYQKGYKIIVICLSSIRLKSFSKEEINLITKPLKNSKKISKLINLPNKIEAQLVSIKLVVIWISFLLTLRRKKKSKESICLIKRQNRNPSLYFPYTRQKSPPNKFKQMPSNRH
jgi:hypothetical protein